MNKGTIAAALPLALALAACDSGSTTRTGGGGGEIKAEAFCNPNGLAGPLRETIVLIDARAMAKTSNAKEFAAKNEWLRDVLLDVADPVKALASNFMAPRERVSIIVLPADGSTGSRTFSGCIPGFTAEEREAIAADSSTVTEFFTGTSENELQEAQSAFRTQLIGGLQAAASLASEEVGRQTGELARTPLMDAFRSTQGLFETTAPARRFVLISDLSGIETGSSGDDADGTVPSGSIFAGAVAAGQKSAARFGNSELFLVQPKGSSLPDKQFLRGFFLAQGADLMSAAIGKVGLATGAPERMFSFDAQARYPSGAQPMKVTLGADQDGKLVNSWMVLAGDSPQPVPLSGRMQCSGAASCTVSSTPGKFSQSWSESPGGEPEFSNDMPFGGMRDFTLSFENGKIEGKVTDSAVGDVGDGRDYIVIDGRSANEEGE